MSNDSLETIMGEAKGKRTSEIAWYDAVDRMVSAVNTLSEVANKLGDTPESNEILATVEWVGDLHQQFQRVFDTAHDEIMDAETGLGCLIKAMPHVRDVDLPPNELACLLSPLQKRLAVASSLFGMLCRG